ncbi:MAG TPA: nucleotidyltransferase family protein [Sphingobacteriaceae bacterium]|nr:nucleotidyltransferase family protein [Sphingobacteriaceae bacterium]
MTISAIVLAGRSNDGAFREAYAEEAEALIPLRGRPLIAPILDALAGVDGLLSVTVVAPPAVAEAIRAWGALRVDPGDSLTGSIRQGLAGAAHSERVLFVAGDAPLVTTATINAFLSACASMTGQFFYPIVTKECYEERFPDSHRTWVRLKDGTFTGGNMFLVDRDVVEPGLAVVDRLYAARKNPLRMLQIIRPALILKLLLGRVAVQELEEQVSRLVGARGRAVVLAHPEIALDVDRPEDIAYVEGLPL